MTEEKKSKFKKIYNLISTVVTAVVFVFLIVVIVVTVLQKKQGEDVKIFGHYMYTVLTDSMEPTISPGDTIWCREVKTEDLKEGAIITFTAPSGPLKGHNETHRITQITYGENNVMQIRTKGDNSDGADSWVLSESSVKAVYVKTLPVISGLMSFMIEKPFLSYVLLIALPLLLVGVLFIVSYVKDKVKAETSTVIPVNAADGELTTTNLDGLTDEEKKRILEEFLAEQRMKDTNDDSSKPKTDDFADYFNSASNEATGKYENDPYGVDFGSYDIDDKPDDDNSNANDSNDDNPFEN